MSRLILLLLLSLVCLRATGQDIRYTIPEGYEKDISAENYKTLVDIAVPVVQKRFAIASVDQGIIQLREGQDMQALNLHNLVRKCVATEDKSQWKEVIESHFDYIFTSLDEEKKMNLRNFDSAKRHLSLRIYPQATFSKKEQLSSMVTRVDLEGTYTVLVLDLPGTFVPLKKDIFEGWHKDAGEVFTAAQSNINRQHVEKLTQTFEARGGPVEISFLGNEDYAASYALDLATNAPEMVGAWGTVLAMPNKGIVDLCKVSPGKPLDFVQFIEKTLPLVAQAYNEHPQQISDQYFWYYKGKFTRIDVVTSNNGAPRITAPAGLSALMTQGK